MRSSSSLLACQILLTRMASFSSHVERAGLDLLPDGDFLDGHVPLLVRRGKHHAIVRG
jgi:hypothetical protein